MVSFVFPGGSEVKASAWNVGDPGLIPGLGRSPGGGHGNPLQCSCLENPRDGGAWWAAIYGVTQSQTRLKQLSSSSSNGTSYPLLLQKCRLLRLIKEYTDIQDPMSADSVQFSRLVVSDPL